MRLGCIGIGSNAIRLLVASWKDGSFAMCAASAAGRACSPGWSAGRLTEESMQSSVERCRTSWRGAPAATARRRFLFLPPARCATRQTAGYSPNAARRSAARRWRLSPAKRKPVLSYIGASEGGACGMIDIGGGSTEFTLGEDERILGAVSLQMGAVRMNAQRPILKL